jgi:hypothetical protein
MQRCPKQNRPWPAGFQPKVDRAVRDAAAQPTDTWAVAFHCHETGKWAARVLTRATWGEWMDPEHGCVPYDPLTGEEWK